MLIQGSYTTPYRLIVPADLGTRLTSAKAAESVTWDIRGDQVTVSSVDKASAERLSQKITLDYGPHGIVIIGLASRGRVERILVHWLGQVLAPNRLVMRSLHPAQPSSIPWSVSPAFKEKLDILYEQLACPSLSALSSEFSITKGLDLIKNRGKSPNPIEAALHIMIDFDTRSISCYEIEQFSMKSDDSLTEILSVFEEGLSHFILIRVNEVSGLFNFYSRAERGENPALLGESIVNETTYRAVIQRVYDRPIQLYHRFRYRIDIHEIRVAFGLIPSSGKDRKLEAAISAPKCCGNRLAALEKNENSLQLPIHRCDFDCPVLEP